MASVGDVTVRITANTAGFLAGMGKVNTVLARTSMQLTNLGTQLSLGLSAPLLLATRHLTRAASQFEDSFTGIRKTVNATEVEFQMLEKQIRQMSKVKPIDVNELNQIGEAAGQLGIKTQNLLGFIDVMADLGVTTNLTSTEAATALARIGNVMGDSQDKFSNMGAAIVDLGNNFATTEREIVEMATRLAPAGRAVKLTTDQVFGFSAALSSVGIEAQAGGSSIARALIKMADAVKSGSGELETFAAVSGMTVKDFVQAFDKDAGKAVQRFVEGLGKISKQGGNAFKVLEELQLNDIRLIQSLIALSNASGLVAQAMDTSSLAYQRNTALAIEAEKRYATFTSQITMMRNRLNDAAITIGRVLLDAFLANRNVIDRLVRAVEVGALAFKNMDSSTRNLVLALAGVAVTIGPVLLAFGFLLKFITPFALLATAAIGLGAAAFIIWRNWEEVAPHLSEIWKGLQADMLRWLESTVGKANADKLVAFGRLILDVFGELQTLVLAIANLIGVTLTSAWKAVSAVWSGDIQALTSVLSTWVSTGLRPVINQVLSMVGRTLGFVWSPIAAQWETGLQGLHDATESIWADISAILAGDQGNALDLGRSLGQWIDEFDKVMAVLKRHLEIDWEGLGKAIWESFTQALENAIPSADAFMQAIGLTQFLEDLKTKVHRSLEEIRGFFSGLIPSPIKNLFQFEDATKEADVLEKKLQALAQFKQRTAVTGGAGLFGDRDPFNRGITQAGQQNPVLAGPLGVVKQEFPIRQATAFELKLENITEDLQGVQTAMSMFQRFDVGDIGKVPARQQAEIMADWRDMQTTITLLWESLKDDLEGANRDILVDMLAKWQKISNELVGQSIIPDMLQAIQSEWMESHTALSRITNDTTEEIAQSWDLSSELGTASLVVRNDLGKVSQAFRLFGQDITRIAPEAKEKGIDLFDSLKRGLVNLLGAESKTLRPLLAAIDALKEKFADKIDIGLPGVAEIQQITDSMKRGVEDLNNITLPIVGLKSVSEIVKDLRDDMDIIAAKTRVLGREYNAVEDEVRALEAALVDLQLIQIKGGQLTEEQTAKMRELEKALKMRRAQKEFIDGFRDIKDTIKGSMREMVSGVLRGTQSVSDLFNNMLQNIALSLTNRILEKSIDEFTDQIFDAVLSGDKGTGLFGSGGGLDALLGGIGKTVTGGGEGTGTKDIKVGSEEKASILAPIGKVFTDMGGGLMDIFDTAASGITASFAWLTGSLSSAFEWVTEGLGSLFEGFLGEGGLPSLLSGFTENIGNLFQGFLGEGGLGGIFSSAISGFDSLFQNLFSGLGTILGGSGGGGGGGDILGSLGGVFGGGGGGGGGIFSSLGGLFGGGGGAPSGVLGPSMAGGSFFSGGGSGLFSSFSGLFGFSKGGIMGPHGPVSLLSFADGGVATGPSLALFGEGSQHEAFVPLEPGKGIPVEMRGAKGITVNMHISTPDARSFRDNLGQVQAETAAAMRRAQQRNL